MDRQQPWRRSFTEDQLGAAVAESTSLHAVFQRLGLQVGGGQWAAVRELIRARGWSTAHWRHPLAATREGPTEVARFRQALRASDLPGIVASARSRADVIRAHGFEPRSSLYRALRDAFEEQGITPAHFEAGHQRIVASPGRRPRRPLEELLVRGSDVGTNTLRRRLLEEGVFEHRCARCLGEQWLGEPIPLQLDHIDGDRTNNLIENLRLLCPNCHAMTDTYCGRNIGRYSGADERAAGDGQ